MRASYNSLLVTSLAAALLATGCAGEPGPETVTLAAPHPLATPAGAGSSEPNLTQGSDGSVYLTWQEEAGSGHELRFAVYDGDGWTEPRTIARGDDWFVNWADFPTLVVLPDGRLAAHYLRRNPTGETYHYDIEVVQSSDGGGSWSSPVRPHRDGVPAEHGFTSLFPDDAEGVGVVWLDGRKYHAEFGGTEEMMLLHTTLAPDGALGMEAAIDERVCDCCQTSWALTSSGPVIAYRGRSADEVRDIRLARNVGGDWVTSPVHEDGWQIAACPVNGPAVVADGDAVAVAWFTAARDTPRVRVALSRDGGATFAAPVDVDSGDPVGRVDLVRLNGGEVLVSWLERAQGEAAEIRGRIVDGSTVGEPVTIARSSGSRASGFPRMARFGDSVIFAWTEVGEPSQVRVARADLERRR